MKSSSNIEEFYYNMGLLSMRFASMEYHLGEIMSKFITDSFVISGILFERNSLYQNIRLLEMINQHKGFEPERIEKMVKEIESVRKDRNLFIHGLWGNPYLDTNNVACVVSSFDLESPKKKDKEKRWSCGLHRTVTLAELKDTIAKIDWIISEQKSILELIEEEGPELRDHIY